MAKKQVMLILGALGDDPDPAGDDREFDWSQVEKCVAAGWTVFNPPLLPEDFAWPEGVAPSMPILDTAYVWMGAEEGVKLPKVNAGYTTTDGVMMED